MKDQIKEYPISKIIEHFIPLKKKGQHLTGLCPFHTDTQATLIVNDDKGIFKCFACGEGGDGIAFVMNYRKIGFVQALNQCAEILGLSVKH